jgi:hypothetical protein
MSNPGWLPALVLFQDSGGTWAIYLDVLYLMFRKDFIESVPRFAGEPLQLKRFPLRDGREATFWHLISEGESEDQRNLHEPRCERIRWPRALIEHSPCTDLHIWESKRGNETRVVVGLRDYSYVMVLARRGGYLLPWTAYPVEREHRRRKLRKEHQEYVQNITGAASS